MKTDPATIPMMFRMELIRHCKVLNVLQGNKPDYKEYDEYH